jgi:hypothetical protein
LPLSRNLGTLTSWKPSGPLQACNSTALPLPLPYTPALNVFQISELDSQKYAAHILRQISFRNISEDVHVWYENGQYHMVMHVQTVGNKLSHRLWYENG